MTPTAALLGTRIRRVDVPHPELLSLVLAGPELRSVLVFCFGSAAGVGLVETRPQGLAADSFVQKLRKELEGGKLSALEQPTARSLGLLIQRGPVQRRLVCDFEAAQISLFDETDHALATHTLEAGRAPKHAALAWPESLEQLLERGPTLLRDSMASAVEQQRAQLVKLVRTARQRLARRLSALDGDIARAEQAPALRTRANLVLQNLHQIKRGETSVQLTDYTQDPPSQITVELDPRHETRAQVETWFKQARRFERGAQLARERKAASAQEHAQLANLIEQLQRADAPALESLAQTARSLGVRGIGSPASDSSNKPAKTPRRKPYREFQAHNHRPILVGKGAEENDALTRDHARPHDLWLHARDVPGAHVVVPLERNETCPQELLLDAAHLAVHHSDARNQTIVDVIYTPRRYVRKRKKSPKGQVQLDQEKVLALHLDQGRLAKLLASELKD